MSVPANVAGAVVYVCALPTDTMGWVADQLDPRGDAVTLAVAIAEGFVLTIPMILDQSADETLSAYGYTRDTTVAEIVRKSPIVRPAPAERAAIA
jgi:hypothetical protein